MPQWVSLLALAALTVAAPSDGTRGISSVVCICAGGHLGLRGGGLAEEQAARERRMAASLGSLRGIASELEGIAREGDDQVVIIPWHLCTCQLCCVRRDSGFALVREFCRRPPATHRGASPSAHSRPMPSFITPMIIRTSLRTSTKPGAESC